MPVKFEQNAWSKLPEILSFLTLNWVFITIFDKEFTPFWKTFLQLKLFSNAKLSSLKTIIFIFQCSKHYGTPTLVTELKVASNMADPISLNENLP